MHNETSVLLVDDHVLYREGLHEIFRHWDDFRIIDDASDGQEAILKCRTCRPDIILMDIQMPGMNGIEATRLIHREFPAIKIVMLTMSAEDKHLVEAFRLGAQGYILKDTSARQLHDCLRGIVRGEVSLSGMMAASFIHGVIDEKAEVAETVGKGFQNLTETEADVLRLVAQGYTNTDICDLLFLSEGMEKKLIRNILKKLDLGNRVQLATYAVRAGLID